MKALESIRKFLDDPPGWTMAWLWVYPYTVFPVLALLGTIAVGGPQNYSAPLALTTFFCR
jgi:hypothetical protein